MKIGDKYLVVNKAYAFSNKTGGKVFVSRVNSFMNTAGVVHPVLSEVGNSRNNRITPSTHVLFNLNQLDAAKACIAGTLTEKEYNELQSK